MLRLPLSSLSLGSKRLRTPSLAELACTILALTCLVLPGWWTLSRSEFERQKELRELLQSHLDGAAADLSNWRDRLAAEGSGYAADAGIRAAALALGRIHDNPFQPGAERYLTELRRRIGILRQSSNSPKRITNFLLISPDGNVLAAGLDPVIGQRLALAAHSPVRTALDGRTVVSLFEESELDDWLSPAGGRSHIVVSSPIENADGSTGAALVMEVDVWDDLRILAEAWNQQEDVRVAMYAPNGEWIDWSDPREPDPVAPQPTRPAVGDILARVTSDEFEATLVTPDLLQGRDHFNTRGYRGFSGREVIGAAGSLSGTGIGLIAEMDYAAAYRAVSRTRWLLIGMTIVLAAVLVLLVATQVSGGEAASAADDSSGRNTAAWAVLVVSLMATGAIWWSTKSKVEEYDQTRFQQEAGRIRSELAERIDRYAESLKAIGAGFEAFGTLQAAQWNAFVGSLKLAESLPAVEYVAFIENVPGDQLAAFETARSESPGGRYRVHPQGPREVYYPVSYIAALEAGSEPVGFDLASSGNLRPAFEKARDTGAMVVSSVVTEGELSRGETGVLMIDPVYGGGVVPEAEPERRARIRGWVTAFVRVSEMANNLASFQDADIDFELFDGSALNPQELLYDHDRVLSSGSERTPRRFQQALLLDVGGRQWTLFFSSTSSFDLPITQNHPAQVLVGGLAISVLLFDIALVLSSTRSRALAIAGLMTRKVRESEARVRAVIDYAPDGIIVFDESGAVSNFNPGAEKLFGYSCEEALGMRMEDLVPSYRDAISKDQDAVSLTDAADTPVRPGWEAIGKRKDASRFPAELTLSRMQPGDRVVYTAIVRDVSERKAAEEALRESEARYALAARAANDGLWDWDLKTDRMYVAPRWKAMLGIEEDDGDGTPEVWFSRVHADDKPSLQAALMDHLEGRSDHFESEHRVLHRDGSYRWMLSRGAAVRNEQNQVVRIAGSQTDITARRQAERQLLYDALHDPLTGLPNRNYFMNQLERCTNESHQAPGKKFGILFLDVDRFKLINDSLGHFVGDQLLISIADRLKICMRPGDTIARLGGDEFAILIEDLAGVSDATRIADRIQKELSVPFRAADQEVFAAVSIGITFSAPGRDSAEDLLRDADTAMYRAKAQGRSRYELFDQGMHARAVEFLHVETALRRALEREEFVIHYQPIVSLKTGEITRCEALIRWLHPERGLIMPASFIPVAEETGLIMALSSWLLRTALADQKAWQQDGLLPIRLAVNISPRQLKQQNLFDIVSRALFDAGVGPDQLELELTESALMESSDETIKPLVELFAKGVQISLDDFGTGYSSLMYLRRFPISNLKIDAAFIKGIGTNTGDAAIASGLIALAHSLDLRVTAEGVETNEQLEFLRNRNCDDVQGHVLSPPVDAAKFAELARRGIQSPILDPIQTSTD